MSSKCLMTDTQYEALISLLLSRYWEQQMIMTLRQCQAVLRAVSNHSSLLTESVQPLH
nr:MAG TPA: hypothetical protein [Caudoviricetes sp.]